AMDQVRAILVAGFTARNAVKETEELQGRAERLREEVSGSVFRDRAGNLGRTAARAGLCLALGGFPCALLWVVGGGDRRQRAKDARPCPRGLAEGTLVLRKSTTPNPLFPDSRYVQCTSCQHEFRAAYRALPRLCFPTVGVIDSGKTRWLLT